MLVKYWRFSAILCLALFLRIEAEIFIENNAYKNVVVSFSPKLSPENGNLLVESMQKILNEASSVLHTATGLQIGSVTFHLPQTWNSSAWLNVNYISSYNSNQQLNIRVNSLTDSAFGKKPIALQYGGCGVPSSEIAIPSDFLLTEEESYSKGKIFAREWLKYRYGVFDENGFVDDPLYPSHYTIPGNDETHITDCTSPKLSYSIRDLENNTCVLTSDTAANCSIRPNEIEMGNVKSSLMFYHEELQQLEHVCGKDERSHNIEAPNKQNILCSYKSIWEVLQLSEDFKSPNEAAKADIKYTFVQESKLRLIVAWQDTLSLHKQGPSILNTVRKLMYDVPAHSEIALYSFKGESLTEAQRFTEITNDIRKTWTTKSQFGSPEEGKPLIVVQKALEVLQQENNEVTPGIILLFTASNPVDNPELVQKLEKSKVCLTVIGFQGATKEGWSKFLEVSKCSSFLEITESTEDAVTYDKLYNAIEPIFPTFIEDSKIQTISIRKLSFDEVMEIPAEPRAKTFTVWIFGNPEFECKVNESVITMKEQATSQTLVSYFFKASNDTVKCKLKDVATGSFLVQVQMTTKEGEYFNNEIWLRDTTPSDSKEQMPYIIYAKIFHGEYPVRNAEVRAEVTTPSGQKVALTLVDDGRGDPDITQNDGIYSKYFIKFDADGTYKVIVTVTDNGGKANASRNGQDPCCGSVIVSDVYELSPFKWTHETSFDVALKKPNDGYKPSRVTDLKVAALNLPNSLTLTWTAPGGEMDEGKASDYQFIMFCPHQDCHEDGVLPNWIGFPNKNKPKDSGKTEAATVQFHDNKPENTTVYLALKTTNENKITSEVSNHIYIKLTPNTPQETTTPENKDFKPSNTPTAGSIVAYVIISIAILMLIVGIIYFLLDRTKRARAFEELNTPAVFTCTDSSIFTFKPAAQPVENPIRRAESIPVVLYTHDQIKDFKDKTKQPPLYRSDAPKQWVSLNALIDGNGSSSSNTTLNVGDSKTQSSEIRQLSDNQVTDKNSRF